MVLVRGVLAVIGQVAIGLHDNSVSSFLWRCIQGETRT